jgi:hypothetical protein
MWLAFGTPSYCRHTHPSLEPSFQKSACALRCQMLWNGMVYKASSQMSDHHTWPVMLCWHMAFMNVSLRCLGDGDVACRSLCVLGGLLMWYHAFA